MPGSERAQVYFIAAMMVLILILSFAAVYIFVRQYRKEMREKTARAERDSLKPEAGDRNGT